jgi:hypothetical protein
VRLVLVYLEPRVQQALELQAPPGSKGQLAYKGQLEQAQQALRAQRVWWE